jgi:hypothetical protein
MMSLLDRFRRLMVIVLLTSGAPASAATNEATATDTSAWSLPATVRDVPTAVPAMLVDWLGERIDFHVAFGIVPAGKARLEVLDTARVNGHLAMHARSTARSAKSFDLVFKVRDSIETWFDADSIYALRFHKRLREGPYRDEKTVEFLLADSLVHWWDDGTEKPPLVVQPRVQDVLSAGYKARLLPMAVGDTFAIRTHDVNKTYDLMVIVHARETVETPAGLFDCFKVEPILRSGGLFKKEKGARVFVWVTADDRRIPVQMESKVSFGTITAVMESYRPPESQR